MTAAIWERVRGTGDTTLLRTDYPILRLARVGPAAE